MRPSIAPRWKMATSTFFRRNRPGLVMALAVRVMNVGIPPRPAAKTAMPPDLRKARRVVMVLLALELGGTKNDADDKGHRVLVVD